MKESVIQAMRLSQRYSPSVKAGLTYHSRLCAVVRGRTQRTMPQQSVAISSHVLALIHEPAKPILVQRTKDQFQLLSIAPNKPMQWKRGHRQQRELLSSHSWLKNETSVSGTSKTQLHLREPKEQRNYPRPVHRTFWHVRFPDTRNGFGQFLHENLL